MEKSKLWTSLSLAKNQFAAECIGCTPGKQFPAVFHQVTLSMAAPQGQPRVQQEQLLKCLPDVVLTWGMYVPNERFPKIFAFLMLGMSLMSKSLQQLQVVCASEVTFCFGALALTDLDLLSEGLYTSLVELHEVPVSLFLQSIEVPLTGYTNLWSTNSPSQFCITCRLAADALCPIIQDHVPWHTLKPVPEQTYICSPEVQGCNPDFCPTPFSEDPEPWHRMIAAAKVASNFHIPDLVCKHEAQ
ncbi:hypothetical protein llap_7916 [Limosa lapponica baueri]|uniref:Uncharacterized protein n=1 Tax=Limosa lapponica baueri TaxID=1758121 RepID=A0A2I0U6R5_LIMLA|nr:hypothetical protein llap_7916 [Limosa lapponica baueri]